MKKIIVLSLILISSPFLSNRVYAQSTPNQNDNQRIKNIFTISPIIIDTKLEKGTKQTYEIQIKNELDAPLGIRANIENFIDESGNSSSRSKAIIDNSTLSESEFIIPEKGYQTIKLSIDVPQNLSDGGYYETVFITPFFSKPIDNSSPTVLSRAGILFLGTVGEINYADLKNKVSVTNTNFKLFYEDSPLSYSFDVHNSYFTHFQAKPFITIDPIFGKSKRLQLQDQNILPGNSKSWEGNFQKTDLSFFNFAKLAVSVGEGNYIYKDFFFLVLPIKEVDTILIALIILGAVKFRGKNIKKAVKILVKGK